jgi:ferrochelatase
MRGDDAALVGPAGLARRPADHAEEWLKPYADETIARLAREGVKSIAVVNPGFASDCLETLEETAIRNAELFLEAGGERFAHIPCLNDSPGGMRAITAIARKELQGWI